MQCYIQLIKSQCPGLPGERSSKARQGRGRQGRGRNYKIVRRLAVPKSDLFFCLDQVPPNDSPTDQSTDRLTDRPYDPRTLSKAKPRRRSSGETEAEAGAEARAEAGRGDRDACGAIRSRCKPLIRSCRYLQILSSSQR